MTESSAGSQYTVHLVEKAKQGDAGAIEELFTRYLPRVKLAVRARMGSAAGRIDDYDDIAQEALTNAFRHLDSFEVRSDAHFRNWMARIVQNAITESFRRETAKRRDLGKICAYDENAADSFSGVVVAAAGLASPSAISQGFELEDEIARVLSGLKEDYREAIILRQICEMSFEDVAKALNRNSEATARKIFSRAVKKLEEGLRAVSEESGSEGS